MNWYFKALMVVENDLVDPNSVPFSPSWVVLFNESFEPDDRQRVDDWIAENASDEVVVFQTGEVFCQSETDALMLRLAFQ